MLIHGTCHCGNIVFDLDWRPEPSEIPARACTCSFCTKHGGVWTSCPTGSLRVRLNEPALVSRYDFGTQTADFHVCMRCGVVPVVTSRIGGVLYAVVNVNTFEGVDEALLRRSPSALDDETHAVRLARRQRNWIAEVEFVERGD
ncbi:GFA family protein [Lysobacter sp. CA196]|uniref:GFA family protein n=1 Tax=Lysobacter sp. CA196 TaxID=3455606 RepID=UPI003F8D5461